MYRHPQVMQVRALASDVVRALFEHFVSHPNSMPGEWAARAQLAAHEEWRLMRLIADYIAGMTDRYALVEHKRLFGSAPSLR